jgi:4-hydroxybutyrate CoA-transferase
MTDWLEASQVADLLQPGMRVFVGGTTAEPGAILAALARHGACCAGVHFVSVTIPGINETDFTGFHPQALSTAFFATRGNRESIAGGRVDFERLSYRQIYDYLANGPGFDLALAQLPAPSPDGDVSLGICADFLPAVLEKAVTVVGEINARQPVVADTYFMPSARLDYVVASDRPVATLAVPEPTEVAGRIAQHVAELVEDGDCLQVGIGAIPNAVLAALGSCNDLGCHSGLVSDGFMSLARSGVLTGRNKDVDSGKMVAPAVLGGTELLEWAGQSRELAIRPVSYTHDPNVIGDIRQFVSINSALQIDLAGQVNVDTIDGSLVSGPGGALDFTRGAARSPGGKAIIAMNSTARGGGVSRIVPALDTGTPVTVSGAEVDFVVTEYGARRLRGLSAAARAEAMMEIAHPDFRESLRASWRALGSQ